MKTRTALIGLVGLVVAVLATRLGFWQLSRLQDTRAANAGIRGARSVAPVAWPADADSVAALVGRRVVVSGTYDESRHVLLAGRSHGAAPGVHVVTPLVRDDGLAVLVNRGWLPAPDAALAHPQAYPESGRREVIGLLERVPVAVSGPPWVEIHELGVSLWSVRRLDLDSLRTRLPGPLSPFLVRELPAAGLPVRPLREAPEIPGESMHLGYALQWFAIALIALVGAFVLARRAPAAPRPDGADDD